MKFLKFLILFAWITLIFASSSLVKKNKYDISSFSDPNGAIQTQINFNLRISLKPKRIYGTVKIYYKCLSETEYFMLDVRNLSILSVKDSKKKPLKYQINKNKENSIGDQLQINFSKKCQINEESFITIRYHTNKNGIGVHFSSKLMAEDPSNHIVYTHAEPIYARAFFPCQDTPSLKVIIKAKIRASKGYKVLFAGLLKSQKEINSKLVEHYFEFDQPLPTYGINLAMGKFETYKPSINSVCTIYAEKSIIESKEKELKATFGNCDKIIKFYSRYHPFRFQIINFIVVPNDYPTNANESPFVIILPENRLSKDGSLSSTVTHELAHYWAGNMVTNKNWESYWINEGIATYMNRKADKLFFGKDFYLSEMYRGVEVVKRIANSNNTDCQEVSKCYSLSPIIKDDPIFTFNSISYEKGSLFLYYIESLIGKKNMLKVMRNYFKQYAFKSVSTEDFIYFLKKQPPVKKVINEIKWEEWIKGKDMPYDFNFKKTEEIMMITDIIDLLTTNNSTNSKEENKNIIDKAESLISSLTIKQKISLLKKIYRNLSYFKPEIIKEIIKFQCLQEHVELKAMNLLISSGLIDNKQQKFIFLSQKVKELKYTKAGFIEQVMDELSEYTTDGDTLFKFLKDNKKYFNFMTVLRLTKTIQNISK